MPYGKKSSLVKKVMNKNKKNSTSKNKYGKKNKK